jgi:transcription initiation factor TFIIIB Brf1 subunit/transcription initiation factor TFIIB
MNFDLIDDIEFDNFISRINDESLNDLLDVENYKICINCNIQIYNNINNLYTCKNCGFIKHITTDNNEYEASSENYNTNNNYNIPIKCVGPNSYNYQKCLRNNTTEYNTVQSLHIKNKLFKLNYNTKKLSISKNIIINVIEKYKQIRTNCKVYRGDILKGILGSLIYYECIKEKIIRKPREIALWCGISESNLSKGDKILKELNEYNVIDIYKGIQKNNLEKDYIISYLKRLKLNEDYLDFIYELLIHINTNKIGNLNSRISTKVSSLIYLLILIEKLNITIENISDEFDISISTVKIYYNTLHKNKNKFLEIFNKYNKEFPDKLRKHKKK